MKAMNVGWYTKFKTHMQQSGFQRLYSEKNERERESNQGKKWYSSSS